LATLVDLRSKPPQQWCTDMEILQSDWIRYFFINSISNPYPKK